MNRITRTPPTSYTLFRFFFTNPLKQGVFFLKHPVHWLVAGGKRNAGVEIINMDI